MFCKSCGAKNIENAVFCAECGQKMTENCPVCGTENPPLAIFCSGCGGKLLTSEPAEVPLPVMQFAPPPAAAPEAPVYMPPEAPAAVMEPPAPQAVTVQPPVQPQAPAYTAPVQPPEYLQSPVAPAKPKKKKGLLIGIIAGSAAAVLAAAALVLLFVVFPMNTYNKAADAFNQEKYETAFHTLSKLKTSYKDVEELLPYYEAHMLMEQENYEAAAAIFLSLKKYEDSPKRLEECNFALAEGFLKAGDFKKTRELLDNLDGYEGAAELLLECDYLEAHDLFNKKDFANAENAFFILGTYKDSQEMAVECSYQNVLGLMEAGQFEDALGALNYLQSYKDCTELENECYYQWALQLSEQGEADRAIEFLNYIYGYKDSAELLNELQFAGVYQTAMQLYEWGRWSEALPYFDEAGYYKDADQKAEEIIELMWYGYNTYDSNFIIGSRWNDYGLLEPYIEKAYVPWGGKWILPEVSGYRLSDVDDTFFALEADDGSNRGAIYYSTSVGWPDTSYYLTEYTPSGRTVLFDPNHYYGYGGYICVEKTTPGEHDFELIYYNYDSGYAFYELLYEIDRIMDALEWAYSTADPYYGGVIMLDEEFTHIKLDDSGIISVGMSSYPLSVSYDLYIGEWYEMYGNYAPAAELKIDVSGYEVYAYVKRYVGGMAMLTGDDWPWYAYTVENYHGYDIMHDENGYNGNVLLAEVYDGMFIMVPLSVRDGEGYMVDNGSWDIALETMRLMLDGVIK